MNETKGIVGKIGSPIPAIIFNAMIANTVGKNAFIFKDILDSFEIENNIMKKGAGSVDGVLFYTKEPFNLDALTSFQRYIVGVRIDMSKDDVEIYTIGFNEEIPTATTVYNDELNTIEIYEAVEEVEPDGIRRIKDVPLYQIKVDAGFITVEKVLINFEAQALKEIDKKKREIDFFDQAYGYLPIEAEDVVGSIWEHLLINWDKTDVVPKLRTKEVTEGGATYPEEIPSDEGFIFALNNSHLASAIAVGNRFNAIEASFNITARRTTAGAGPLYGYIRLCHYRPTTGGSETLVKAISSTMTLVAGSWRTMSSAAFVFKNVRPADRIRVEAQYPSTDGRMQFNPSDCYLYVKPLRTLPGDWIPELP